MKTINDYTIYCTPEQTKKALKLGAQMETVGKMDDRPSVQNGFVFKIIPTAEQMIGWLRTKGCTPYVYPVRRDEKSVLYARLRINLSDGGVSDAFHGFGEDYSIILAAIDAALEYLTNKKQ